MNGTGASRKYARSAPCDLIGGQGVYLTRETTGTQTACEFWQRQ
jgi:hypothetical protein